MTKKHIYIALLLTLISQLSFAQKAQRLAYIDMAFVLDNIPEYNKAQNQLDSKVKAWQRRLEREKNDIEALKKDFSNEKALLTPELIQEREDDIYYKEQDYKKLQEAYFGPKGDLYLYRKLLVQPIQDKVYNFIQEIAVKKRYDFVVDKSSDLILLYTNKKYDISDLVVNGIVRDQKKKAIQDKRKKAKNKVANKTANKPKKTSRFGRIFRKKAPKNNTRKAVVNKNKAIGKKVVVAGKVVIDKTTSNKDTLMTVKIENKDSVSVETKPLEENTNVLKEVPSNDVLKRIEARNAKRKIMLEKIRLAKEAKNKKKVADRKAALDKRAARIKELEKYKEELNRKRDSAQQARKDKKKKDN
jgi:Skp family chaperone for outer membrane proteins